METGKRAQASFEVVKSTDLDESSTHPPTSYGYLLFRPPSGEVNNFKAIKVATVSLMFFCGSVSIATLGKGTQLMPLLIYLHGAGESGDTNDPQGILQEGATGIQEGSVIILLQAST
jgi:hypothetical protein